MGKRTITYACDAVRDRDLRQTGAIFERSIAYARDAVWDRNRMQRDSGIGKGPLSYFRHRFIMISGRHFYIYQIIGNTHQFVGVIFF